MSRIVKMVLVSVIAIIILIALITGSNILFFWSIFNWLQETICIIPAIDESLAKALAAFLVAIIVMLPLGKMALSFTPIPQKNKSLYRSLILVCVGIFFMFMYFGTEKIYFNPQTGLPMKYYSIGLDGKIKISSMNGYDPETGAKLLPVTKEAIQKMKGIAPTETVNNPPSTQTLINGSVEKSEKNVIESPKEIMKKSIVEADSESRPKLTVDGSHKITGESMRTDFTSSDFFDNVSELPKKDRIKLLQQEIEDHVLLSQQRMPIGQLDAVEPNIKKPAKVEKVEKVEKKEHVRTLHEILTGRLDPESTANKNDDGLTGYSVSIFDNPGYGRLQNIFEEKYRGPRSSRHVCETVFNNTSHGTFEVFDLNKAFLFKIPPKKKSTVLLRSGCYYFKSFESTKYIPLNLPTWSEFTIKFSDEKTMTPGEIFIGAILSN